MKYPVIKHFMLPLLFFPILLTSQVDFDKVKQIDPSNWSEAEWKLAITPGTRTDASAVAENFMILDLNDPRAAYAGYKILHAGGDAIDAALGTAFTSIVFKLGSETSFAGIMNLMYYEAATGKVYNMNAGYNTVLKEKDPLTIPKEKPSGRTVLVPGFMAGAQSAHQKFGNIAFKDLFAPAIHFAEKGIKFDDMLNLYTHELTDLETLERLPETKAIFTNENGEWLKTGDTIKQSALANTLKEIAKEGADHMYTGEWAKHFVEAVQREGGKMTIQDLANYEPYWNEPIMTSYKDYNIYGPALPTTGGLNIAEALNVLSYDEKKSNLSFTEDPEKFANIQRTSYLPHLYGSGIGNTRYPDSLWQNYFKDISRTPENRLKMDHARKLYQMIQSDRWNKAMEYELASSSKSSDHTDITIAVDKDGNMAVITFTNIGFWGGKTMLFVDGVSIPDPVSSANNKEIISNMKPGERLQEALVPLIVLKHGNLFLGSNIAGTGVHEYSLQNLILILDEGMKLHEVNKQPHFTIPLTLSKEGYEDTKEMINKIRAIYKEMELPEIEEPEGLNIPLIMANSYSPEFLVELNSYGQSVQEVHPMTFSMLSANWSGIQVDLETGKISGVTSDPNSGGVYGD